MKNVLDNKKRTYWILVAIGIIICGIVLWAKLHVTKNTDVLSDKLLSIAFTEAQKIVLIDELGVTGLISRDTAYLSETKDSNSCEVVFPVKGQDYCVGVSITRKNENSEWALFPVNAVTIYDPKRWEQSALITNITVVSDENSIEIEPYSTIKSSTSLLKWIDIVYDDYQQPFHIYDTDGNEKYGTYTVVDAETKEELDFFRPSGLSPQTYIFQNAKSGQKYVVTVAIGFGVTEEVENGIAKISDTETATYSFGVKLP